MEELGGAAEDEEEEKSMEGLGFGFMASFVSRFGLNRDKQTGITREGVQNSKLNVSGGLLQKRDDIGDREA